MQTDDPKYAAALRRLMDIMNDLRSQCPWDKKQTMHSLQHLTVEETYELCDAILDNDSEEIKKELGDLLLHIVFYAKIADEEKLFDLADVIESVCDKLVRRHPHVYGDSSAKSDEEIKRNWELIKQQERAEGQRKDKQGTLSGVPRALPSLLKAHRIQAKAHGVGFDWDNKQAVWGKIEEELAEFRAHCDADTITDPQLASEEFGDILFSLVNYARFVGIDADSALTHTNNKFIKRFNFIETHAQQQGKQLNDLSLAEMDALWDLAKQTQQKDSNNG